MTVTRYAQINIAGVSLSAHPVHYICTTTAELPASGLKLGDTALALDTNIVYKAASSSTWAQTSSTVVASTLVVKAADESVTSSTTLQNDNHLFFPMAANEVWLVSATYFADVNNVASPGHLKLGLSLPAGATCVWEDLKAWSGNGAAGLLAASMLAAADTRAISLPALTAVALCNPVVYRYRVTCSSTAGNFQLTWAQNASNANPTFMRRYSSLAALKLA